MPIKPSLSESFKNATKMMRETGAKSVTVRYGSEKKEEKKPVAKSKPAPAKKQSAGGIVDAKAKGTSIKPEAGAMAKKVEVKKLIKKKCQLSKKLKCLD